MSFSSIVKNELCRLDIKHNCCLLSELAAVVRINGTINFIDKNEINIRIITENAAFARKIFSIIKKLYNIYPETIIRKSKKLKKHVSYILVITASMGAKKILEEIGIIVGRDKGLEDAIIMNDLKTLLKKPCCKKAYLRGAFLAGGSASDPEKTYHLEIVNHSKTMANETSELMNSFKLNAKVIRRKGSFVIYLKEGENIVDFLNIIGAHSALLELENVRIIKEMRNNVNRIVNCETANLEKTVNASVRQVENIKFIRDTIGFENLPESLQEVAELRLQYNDVNLKELGEMLNPPLGKSGINHRLRKIDKIAEEARNCYR
ncbi:MAG TPA: DNA-binding protein WhiA [Clostridia bacterium]|nr:DNA-binding protein WhiA [Clostridia bacterium]